MWQRLGIDSGELEAFKGFNPLYDGWQAGIIKVPPVNGRRFAVLKISTKWEEDRRYLVFQRDKSSSARGDWRFVGHVDFIFNRHLDSVHTNFRRVVVDADNTWLVLRYESDAGTGVFSINEAWYRIGEKVTRVLDYPIYGYSFVMKQAADRTYRSRIVAERRERRAYTVKLLFSVKYSAFTKTQAATYEWNPRSGRFVLNARKSQVSENEIEEVYSCGFIPDDHFLNYYYPELRWISLKGFKRQKEWLAEAIRKMPGSDQKSALEKGLQAGES